MAEATLTRYLIDTCLLIDAFRARRAGVEYLATLDDQATLCVSHMTLMEMAVGCRDRAELTATLAWLANFESVPLTESISDRAVELVATYALSHRLQAPDALIAATALVHNWPLCTLNLRHFSMIEGLAVTRPY